MRSLNPRPARFAPLALKSLVALAFALPGLVSAQNLLELYNAARAYDATYLAARALAESAEFRAAQAEALNLPSANVTAGATSEVIDVPTIGTGDSNTVQAALNARYALFNRANQSTVEQARKSLEVAKADLETVEQDLVVRVAQAYFDVLAAQDTLSATSADKTAIAEQLASAKRNFEVGTATITDTREAQARFDRGLATELAAENDLRVKRVTLDQLVGRVDVSPKPLAVPVALPAVEPLAVEPWLQRAEEGHPQLRRARLGLEVAQLEIDKARAGNAPTLDLTGSLGGQDASGRGASPKGFTSSASVGVQFKMPLYTGGATDARIKETLALAERSRNDVEFARRTVAENTKRAFLSLQSLGAQVRAFESAEASSKLALEATQLGYKVGVRVNLDVLNAQAQLFATQNDLAKARFDSLMVGLRLRQASGQLRPEDIAALDALLAK